MPALPLSLQLHLRGSPAEACRHQGVPIREDVYRNRTDGFTCMFFGNLRVLVVLLRRVVPLLQPAPLALLELRRAAAVVVAPSAARPLGERQARSVSRQFVSKPSRSA